MAQFTPQKKLLPEPVLDDFKYEVAGELGLTPQVQQGYWGELTSRDCGRVGGKIGGSMVKVMIKHAEQAIANGQKL